ncbi:hypothetical protein COT42_01545 [Candidatus Saganbacteria bacterium CG08_land_8_20_14_0_20_45_16]|uniref:HD domain-containing protein n=1 Tax=Candidatus Saganbacteria bacterium CG08_land_8_20_14_0_20_45_16 TaxID=2014293 RepID=A0A2H0Y155_UNCSA|nr:MAG: hypothetical protein COT42_01545 [Candidatus Saganbacteria bacterium CG08_land_8_20_14_0_20_45_16]
MLIAKLALRLRQFYFSRVAKYTKADEGFARSYLNIEEWALFSQLPEFEKKHCVVVGRRMLWEAGQHPDLDERKLVRLGLLHDIGKIFEHNSIYTKAFMVLLRFFVPRLYDYLAKLGENHRFLRRFFIHKHHGREGAKLLERMGESSEVVAMVAKHDPHYNPWGLDDPLELKLLQEADSAY